MPRPRKCRKVCRLPRNKNFSPETDSLSAPIILTVDEYEAVRLIDYESFSQEDCAGYMQVARTTAQLIYNNARKKIAAALVEGRGITIEGGDYRLCDGNEDKCNCGGCRRHKRKSSKEI